MRLYIHESDTVIEVIERLVQECDPDFPLDMSSGLSSAISRRFEKILRAAADDVTFVHATKDDDYKLIAMIRRDKLLMQIAKLPWIRVAVQPDLGSIVLAI